MEIILAGVIAFITTNIDDIFILTLFFGNSSYRAGDIVIGQYLGISTLIAVSFIGSFIGLVIDPVYIGLLGLIPIYLGIKAAIRLVNPVPRENVSEEKQINISPKNNYNHVFSVASVTIANGGDNISIYIPLFATLAIPGKIIMTVIFLIMTAIWCLAAKYLTKHPLIRNVLEKYGHIITPFIFVFLGIYILYESGTFNLILKN